MAIDMAAELLRFSKAHIDIHGRNWRSRKYLQESIEIWTEAYGREVSARVEAGIREHWAKKSA